MAKTEKQAHLPAAGDPHSREQDHSGYDRDLEAGRIEKEGDRHSTTLSASEGSGGNSSTSSSPSSSRRHSTVSSRRGGSPARRAQSPGGSPVARVSTNVSLGPDNPVEHYTSFVEVPDSVYDRIPQHRKLVIVALLSYCAFLAPISSTTVLSAVPEVAATYKTNGSIIGLSNALYMLFMGLSPIVWGPFSEVWGRKSVSLLLGSLSSCLLYKENRSSPSCPGLEIRAQDVVMAEPNLPGKCPTTNYPADLCGEYIDHLHDSNSFPWM